MLLKVNLYSIIFCVLCNISALGQVKAFYGKTISEKEMDAFVKKQMDSLNMPGLSIAVINNGKIVANDTLQNLQQKNQNKHSVRVQFQKQKDRAEGRQPDII